MRLDVQLVASLVLMVGFWSFFLFESSPCIFACGMLLVGRFFLGGNACIAEVSFLFNVAITIFPESSHSLRKHRPLQSPNVDHENPWVLWVPAWFWHKCSSCVIVRLGSTYIKSPAALELFHSSLSIPVTPLFFLGAPDFRCGWNSSERMLRRTSLAFSASSLGRRSTSYFHAGGTKIRNPSLGWFSWEKTFFLATFLIILLNTMCPKNSVTFSDFRTGTQKPVSKNDTNKIHFQHVCFAITNLGSW